MINITDMKNFITIKNKVGNDIVFANPYIYAKDTLRFEFCSVDGVNVEYNAQFKTFMLITKKSNKLSIKLNEENINFLNGFYKEEFTKVTDFYKKCKSEKIDILISDKDVYCKELIDTSYNPYYTKLFVYVLNEYFNIKDKDLNELSEMIISKVDLSKYKKVSGEWDYYSVPLISIKK